MSTNKISVISQSPYYDDFNPSKDYLRVLFRPSFPVQARELTTLQSFLQEQISRFGNNIFKEGARISAAEVTLATDVKRITLTGSGNIDFPSSGADSSAVLTSIGNLEGKIIRNSDGTVKARVVSQPTGTTLTDQVGDLYVKYLTTKEFDSAGGYLYASTTDNPTETTTYYNTYSAVANSSLAHISEGVYYIKNAFVRVAEQVVLVSATSSTPSCQLGFVATETVITQNDDSTLYDNARGSSNESAPGAHRLKIELTFATKPIGAAADSSFYRIATYSNGIRTDNPTSSYNAILDEMARRTYDESGHYSLRPFTHLIESIDSEEAFNLIIGPSKAYVKGYEISKNTPTTIDISKGTNNTKVTRDYRVPFEGTTSVEVTSVTGALPGQTGGNPYASTNRLKFKNALGQVIGVARGYALLDELYQGSAHTKLYFYDVRMFTTITMPDSTFKVATNDVVETGKIRGYVYTDDSDSTLNGDTGFTVINPTGRFKSGQTITSVLQATTGTISAAQTFTFDDVATVSGGTFSATIVAGSLNNSNTELVVTLDKTLKTTQDQSGNSLDYDFSVIKKGTSTATVLNTANGYWDYARYDNSSGKEATEKVIKFKYLKIKNISTARSGIGYGWSAADKEVSLFYPDVYSVYGINSATANTWATARWTVADITTSSTIPQGSIVTGATSGTKAIVALANSTANPIASDSAAVSALASNTAYHRYAVGTGSASQIEVIFTSGSAFTAGERLTVEVPAGNAAYTYAVTFNSSEAPVGSDLSGAFSLDNGQRGEYYDVGRLSRKDNVPAPTTDIVVFYSYFEPTVTDVTFYNVDSYKNHSFFGVDARYGTRNLRNSIDFRLRANTLSTITASPFNFSNRSFEDQSRILPRSQYTTDIEEYLGRVDMISLNKDGQFIVTTGVASTNPNAPVENEDMMTLSFLNIPPAVRYPEYEVVVTQKDNKRYTMRDIGRIDRKVQDLEKAVALSVLESKALLDDVSGRTKSGFVTDDFSTTFLEGPADLSDYEFNATSDIVSRYLLPAQTEGVMVEMEQTSSSNLSTFFDGYVIRSFTEEAFLSQTNATSGHRINPFAVWSFKGVMKIDPANFHWRERVNTYFTSLYGNTSPISAEDYLNYSRITTSSPGGKSSTVSQWTGGVWSATYAASTAIAVANRYGGGYTTSGGGGAGRVTFQAKTTTTTTTFNEPRATGKVTETITGTQVIDTSMDYWIPGGTVVNYKASGLRPEAEHAIYFDDEVKVTSVTSDEDGEITGSFSITGQKYKVGTYTVTAKDTKSNGSYSSALAVFTATGHVDDVNVVLEQVTSTTSSTTVTAVKQIDFYDPIAQLFTLPIDDNASDEENKKQTAIITSVDLWLDSVDTRASMDKIIVEIRESVNGYPGGPDKILGHTGFVKVTAANAASSPSTSNLTNFKFLEPIVLNGLTEYAIVIKSPSDRMSVWVATLGEPLAGGSGRHDTQPLVGGYAGSFFVSQNSSTWSAEQNTDLSFRLNRAVFDTSTVSTVTYNNVLSNTLNFNGDIGAFSRGLCIETFENSNYVRVIHPNHGLDFSGAQVTIAGLSATETYNAIPGSEINGTHNVLYPTLNSYFIKTTTFATASGFPPVPIFDTFATQCVVYDALLTNLMAKKQDNDTVTLTLDTTSTNSCYITVDAATKKLSYPSIAVPSADTTIDIPVDAVVEFEEPKIVRNTLNNTAGNDLSYTVTLGSGSAYSSPFYKKNSNTNIFVFRNVVGYLPTDSDIEALDVRAGSTTDDDVNQQFASYASAVQAELEHSAYITKQVDLEFPADGFTVIFDADMEPTSSVEAAYKIRPLGDNVPFEELQWIDFPTSEQINEINYGPFTSDYDMKSYTLRVATPYEYSSFKIRLRMRTQNESQIPHIRDLRIIADVV